MSLISNASPDELSSPFYAENKRICESWEKFIIDHGGKLNGQYNAWSYSVKSIVNGKSEWLIDIKKSTYSGGNLLLSSKFQNIQEQITFTGRFKNTNCQHFNITKSIFKRKYRNHPFFASVLELVKTEIDDRSLFEVTFKADILKIVIHHNNERFTTANRILDFDYEV